MPFGYRFGHKKGESLRYQEHCAQIIQHGKYISMYL